MGSGGRGSVLWVAVVAVVITIGSLATVGLLPGQETNAVSVRVAATSTTAPRRLTTTLPRATTSVPSSTVPALTSPPSTASDTAATPETTRAADAPAPTAGTTAPPATTGTTIPFKLDPSDPTCQAIDELLGMIDDAEVRSVIEAEYRNSGCAGG